jgi:hypothetical protein
MAGTSSDIQIASNSLILLGHEPISSFTEGTTGSQVASNLYESSYNSMLVTYRWRFATKKAKLARLSETPLNDYSYQFQLPTDLMYLISATSGTDYDIYEDKLYSNQKIEEIDYIYKVAADKLPAYYIKALEFFLAMQFAIPITGDIDKMRAMKTLMEDQLRLARHSDSTQRPADTLDDNPYSEARWS